MTDLDHGEFPVDMTPQEARDHLAQGKAQAMPDFEEALQGLLDEYCDTPLDDKISALELALMALQEESSHAE